jgi:hypothetical protein
LWPTSCSGLNKGLCKQKNGCSWKEENNPPLPGNSECNKGYDIIIVAGQSNTMSGKFKNPDLDDMGDRVYQLGRHEGKTDKIIPANKPHYLHFHTPAANMIGFVESFVKEYKKEKLETGRCVLILPEGKGGTGFWKNEWGATGELSKELVKRANKVSNSKNKIVAF